MKVTGACFCGAIAYEAEIDPQGIGVCHCRDCQIFSGSAYRLSCIADPAGFVITRGEPRYFEKTADSGKVRRMSFCGNCGTHIGSLPPESEMQGNYLSLRLATCDQFDELKPNFELFCASRVPWLEGMAGCVQFEGMPG